MHDDKSELLDDTHDIADDIHDIADAMHDVPDDIHDIADDKLAPVWHVCATMGSFYSELYICIPSRVSISQIARYGDSTDKQRERQAANC